MNYLHSLRNFQENTQIQISDTFFFNLLLHSACCFNHFFTVPTNAHPVHFKTLKSHIKILNITSVAHQEKISEGA
jgi:hypothetical protein